MPNSLVLNDRAHFRFEAKTRTGIMAGREEKSRRILIAVQEKHPQRASSSQTQGAKQQIPCNSGKCYVLSIMFEAGW
jgi:hypothetical protein